MQRPKSRKHDVDKNRKQNVVKSNEPDSRHFPLATYTAFDEESDFHIKMNQFQSPEAKT